MKVNNAFWSKIAAAWIHTGSEESMKKTKDSAKKHGTELKGPGKGKIKPINIELFGDEGLL